MHATVVTKDPTAVAVEVQSAYLSVFPAGNPQFVAQVFTWATECFTGHFHDYQAVDAPYHDFEHTLQGTLCMARLLRGWHRAGAQPQLTQRMFELGLLAILLHDSGYLKKRGDTEGTGAKYTVTHVARSMEFAAELLGEKGFNTAEIQSVQRMIHCTGLDAALAVISFSSELERRVGYALGTADLLGQMAAGDYVEKLPVLFEEFAEAARHSKARTHLISLYSSAEDLMRKTPAFWENFVQLKLKRDLGGVYRYLNEPFPDGPNRYLECIESNMARLRQRFQL